MTPGFRGGGQSSSCPSSKFYLNSNPTHSLSSDFNPNFILSLYLTLITALGLIPALALALNFGAPVGVKVRLELVEERLGGEKWEVDSKDGCF